MHQQSHTPPPLDRREQTARCRRALAALLGAALAVLLLSACGDGSSGASSATAHKSPTAPAQRPLAGRNAQRLNTFAACMAQNGVHLPAPNTSGKGPVFDTKGLDTKSAAFRSADAKCARTLFAGAGGPPAGRTGPGAPAPTG